jgi:hypothetical protein
LQGDYSEKLLYQNSEYEVHQVGPKIAGSQNVRVLAFKEEAVGVAHILRSPAPTRDRRNFFSLKS